jgi:hypothetical protein
MSRLVALWRRLRAGFEDDYIEHFWTRWRDMHWRRDMH